MHGCDLSVILVSWNTRELLLECLAGMAAALGALNAEVWVVDNGSSDGSAAAVAEQFPAVRLISNSGNRGFAAANNQALRASRGRYALLLNSDTVVAPGSLEALVRFADLHPAAGIVGPRLLNADGSLQPSWAAFPTIGSELRGVNVRERSPYPTADGGEAYAVDWVGGACLLIQRRVVEQIGLMDEQFFMYCEEADWCFRARQAGWAVCYYPGVAVVHLGGRSSRMASERMRAELYRSKLIFFYKHRGLAEATALALLLLGGFLTQATRSWRLWRVQLGRRAGPPAIDTLLPAMIVAQTMVRQTLGRRLLRGRQP